MGFSVENEVWVRKPQTSLLNLLDSSSTAIRKVNRQQLSSGRDAEQKEDRQQGDDQVRTNSRAEPSLNQQKQNWSSSKQISKNKNKNKLKPAIFRYNTRSQTTKKRSRSATGTTVAPANARKKTKQPVGGKKKTTPAAAHKAKPDNQQQVRTLLKIAK